ncbi:MAG: SEC-C metal-binding domain-containing protein [Eubacteriales bacterium]|nr:SEC-C metal-binding domain-containing protein [Eubacteriales bacterium]
MSLYDDWQHLINDQTQDTVEAFWNEYSHAEMKLYAYLLSHKGEKMEGKIGDLCKEFDVRPAIFEGFLDGIQESVKEDAKLGDIKGFDEDTEVSIDPDLEKLYLNMLKADAKHLYSLKEWEGALDEEKRAEITKEYKKSKIYHAPKKIGRNDPCWCGSGKKYKNCHMKQDQEEARKAQENA